MDTSKDSDCDSSKPSSKTTSLQNSPAAQKGQPAPLPPPSSLLQLLLLLVAGGPSGGAPSHGGGSFLEAHGSSCSQEALHPPASLSAANAPPTQEVTSTPTPDWAGMLVTCPDSSVFGGRRRDGEEQNMLWFLGVSCFRADGAAMVCRPIPVSRFKHRHLILKSQARCFLSVLLGSA